MKRIFGSAFLLLFGVVFLAVGLWIRSGMQPYDDGVTTTGVVVAHETREDSDGDTTYAAVWEFDTEVGRTIRKTDSISSSSPPAIGSEIEVSYRIADPEGARNLSQPAWFPMIFIGIGALVVLIGLATFIPLLLGLGVLGFAFLRRGGSDDEVFGSLDPATGHWDADGPSGPMPNPTGPTSTYDR